MPEQEEETQKKRPIEDRSVRTSCGHLATYRSIIFGMRDKDLKVRTYCYRCWTGRSTDEEDE